MISNHVISCIHQHFHIHYRYSKEQGRGVLIDFGLSELKEGIVEELENLLNTHKLEGERENE